MVVNSIPYDIITSLEVIFTYAKEIESWLRLKNELMIYLSVDRKKLFSVRDKKTNRQRLNDMEREIIELWVSWGGKRLRLPQDYE